MPASPDGIMASDVSSFGSFAFTCGEAKRPAARNVDTNKKENRKSLPRIECLPWSFLEHDPEKWIPVFRSRFMLDISPMLDGIGGSCQERQTKDSAASGDLRAKPAKRFGEFFAIKRLDQKPVHARFKAGIAILDQRIRGQGENGRPASGSRFVAADTFGGLDAVEAGHLDIHQHQIVGRAGGSRRKP